VAKRVDPTELRELAEWRPDRGLITVCLRIDPADRRESWRSQLRDGLKRLVEGARERDRALWVATKATAERVLEEFPEARPHQSGRTQIGFVEVAEKKGRERWYSFQLSARATEVVLWERPYLGPLVELLDDGAPLGVLAVGAEHVKLWEWSLGECEQITSWEPEFSKRDWRERRAPQSADPGRSQGPSAAGKDQVGQRLDANRERFLHGTGRALGEPMRSRGWRALLAFGSKDQVDTVRHALEPLAAGLEQAEALHLVAEKDIVGEGERQVAERVESALEELNRNRELALIRKVESAAHAEGGHASLGRQETLQALDEGRVAHLLFDPAAGFDGVSPRPAWGIGEERGPEVAEMIEQALRTSAWVTPVEGKAAEALSAHEGVAALLRY
jgi:Bacterial archaeo-eukaryotic release factor family 10